MLNKKISVKEKFNAIQINSLKRIIEDVIKSKTGNSSYFKLNQIIKKSIEKAEKDRAFAKNNYLNDIITELTYELAEDNERLFNIERDKTNLNGNYTTKDLLVGEKKCLELAQYQQPVYFVDNSIVEEHLSKMPLISPEQREAVYHVCYSNKMVSIYQGLAGAGKSFTSKAIKESFKSRNFDIKGIALSWNAAGVLSASAEIDDCQAIEAFCIVYNNASKQKTCMFEKDTLIIVDEAGLVGTRHMSQILESAYDAYINHGIIVKVVLTGDALQLLPVNAGGMFKTLERYIGSATIGTIRRQVQESHRKMVKYASERRSGNAIYTLLQQENIKWGINHEITSNKLIQDFISYKIANPDKSALVLALNNNHVIEINNKIREAYKKLGFLRGIEIETTVSDGKERAWRSKFAKGDQVVVRANYRDVPIYHIPKDSNGNVIEEYDVSNYIEKRMGVFNRNNGKIVKILESNDPIGSYDIYIDMEGDLEGRMIINTKKMLDGNTLPMHHNYATTIYASQGQTVKQVFMLYDPNMNFRLFYVGISRHTDNITMYINENQIHKQMDKGNYKKVADFDENGNEIMVELGRYTKMEMLKHVSTKCGQDQQNKTSLDYMYEISNPEAKRVNERELYEIKPANINEDLNDFDNFYKVIKEENIKNQEAIDKWWQNLYIEQNTLFVTDENKLNKIYENAKTMNEEFVKYKNKILKINNFNEDYVLEVGDRIYFKEKISKKYPIINLKKLLQEEDKSYTETIIIPEMEVDKKRFIKGIEGFSPIYNQKENEKIISKESEELNKLSMIDFLAEIESFSERKVDNSILEDISQNEIIKKEMNNIEYEDDYKTNHSFSISKNNNVFDNFLRENEEKLKNVELNIEREEDNIKNIEILPKIQFLEEENPFMVINKKGDLEVISDENKIYDEDFINWLNNCKTQMTEEGYFKLGYWEEGKYHEPRFLAIDGNEVIREKYDQFGNAKLGTGYPAILSNPISNNNTPIFIVPGVIEWLWSYRFYMKNGFNSIDEMVIFDQDYEQKINYLPIEKRDEIERQRKKFQSIPEILWDAHSTDYGIVKEYAKGRPIKIFRGKNSKNEEWALKLREKLWKDWYLKIEIVPAFPNEEKYEVPWKNATEEELRIAEGNFKKGDLIREIAKMSSKRI